ncbi:MAG: hypothetical protein IE927_04905, partial [Rhodobacterales bacterium]|nr:hypothetical protein [Rhodobacterales bacterium]
MASLRLRLLNALLRGLVRPRLARMTDPLVARREIEVLARLLLRLPRGVRAGR